MYSSQRPNVVKWTLRALLGGIIAVVAFAGCGGKAEKPKDANYYDGPQKKLGESQKGKGGGADVQ